MIHLCPVEPRQLAQFYHVFGNVTYYTRRRRVSCEIDIAKVALVGDANHRVSYGAMFKR